MQSCGKFRIPRWWKASPGQPGTRISVLGCGRAQGYQRNMARHPIRILGIDPGLRRTGWGLIESDGNRLILYRLRFG